MNKSIIGKNLLVITAHPDDESYLAGGTIYQNRKAGGRTTLICASEGEKGTSKLKKPLAAKALKALRRKELTAAAKIIGVRKLIHLDFPDGAIAAHRQELFKKCLEAAKEDRPDFIISFNEYGSNGHHDHIAVGAVALRLAKKLKITLATSAFAPKLAKNAIKWMKKRRRAKHYSDNIVVKAPNIRIPLVRPDIKLRALRAHKSQMPGGNPFHGFPKYAAREILKAEYFAV